MQAKKKVDHKAILKKMLESGRLEDFSLNKKDGLVPSVLVSVWNECEIGKLPRYESYVYHRSNDYLREYQNQNSRGSGGELPVKYSNMIATLSVRIDDSTYEKLTQSAKGSLKMTEEMPANIKKAFDDYLEARKKSTPEEEP